MNPTPLRSVIDDLVTGKLEPSAAESQLVSHLAQGAEAVDRVTEIVGGLVAGIEEFKVVVGRDDTATAKLLELARRRFAIQVSAVVVEDEPEDANRTTGSVQRLREEVVQLADRVAELVENTIRHSVLQKELEIAGTVQKMLVPADAVSVGDLVAHAWFRPADECSGDFWSFAKLGSSDALVVVGDVTGHGAPAAIVAATAKGALDMARVGMRDALRPFMALNMLNHILIDNLKGEYFMTGLVARFEAEATRLRIANAGHRAPWILRKTGDHEVITGQRSAPLGSSRRTKYVDEAVPLLPGDVFVAFTDGIPEAESDSGSQFGERALRSLCEKHLPSGPAAICAAVKAAVEAHVGDLAKLDDDVTLLVIQVPA